MPMDVAAADALAKKKLAQIPRLNKKVQDARAVLEHQSRVAVSSELAAAQARVAKLQATVPPNVKLKAYSDKSGLISSSSKYTSKRLTVADVKAELAAPQLLDPSPPPAATAEVGKDATVTSATAGAAVKPGATVAAAAVNTTSSGSNSATAWQATTGTDTAAAAANSAGISPGQVGVPAAAAGTPATAATAAAGGAAGVAGCTTITVLGTAAMSGSCQGAAPCSSSQRSSRSTSSGGSTHRSHGSSTSGCCRSRQQQQQIAKADDILSKINDYVAAELSAADAAASSLMSLQHQQHQQLQQSETQAPLGQRSGSQSSIAASSGATKPADTAAASTVALAKAASPEGIGGEWTPGLMASLAMRFQGYNQPPGSSSMPDLATIVQTVQQREQEAVQQRQQQQEQWLLQQGRQQQAKQMAANRHLQLYQLGVAQQRKKLQQGKSTLLPRQPAATAAGRALPAPQQAQQQEQQEQQQEQQEQQQGSLTGSAAVLAAQLSESRVRFNDAGSAQHAQPGVQQTASAAATDGNGDTHAAAQPPAASCSPDDQASLASGGSRAAAALPPVADQPQPSRSSNGCDNITSRTGGAQHAGSTSTSKASAAAGCSSTSTGQHGSSCMSQQVLLQSQCLAHASKAPCVPRYKADWPGAPMGASHGHLSPAGLKFEHLPGSTRQVYAQIEDALACNEAIVAAEQELRALRYPPSGAGRAGSAGAGAH